VIALVTGAPGSGKSYYAVRIIADSLMRGQPVATNIELKPGWERRVANLNPLNRLMPWRRRRVEERLRANLFVTADLEELFRVRVSGKAEGRFKIVLDECHNWMNARTWDSDPTGRAKDKNAAVNARLEVVRFFSQHRKIGADVYAITQDAANIDRQVRTLFEYHIRLKALHNFKVMGVRIVPFKYFLALWFWNDGAKTLVKRQGYPLTGIRKIYDTMALSHGLEDLREDRAIWLPRKPAAPDGAAPDEVGRRPAPLPERPEPAAPTSEGPAVAAQPLEGGARDRPADAPAAVASWSDLPGPAAAGHSSLPAVSVAVTVPSDAYAKVTPIRSAAEPLSYNVERPGSNRVALGGTTDGAVSNSVT